MTKQEFEQTERIINESITTGMMVSTTRVLSILESALELEKDEKEKQVLERLINKIQLEQCMGMGPNRAKVYSETYRYKYLDKIQ